MTGAATDAGLHYRILYLEPALLRRSLAASYAPLPFVRDPVVTDRRLRETLLPCLSDIEGELDELAVVQLVTELADGLSRHADGPAPSRITLDVPRLEMARDYLEANLDRVVDFDARAEHDMGSDRHVLAKLRVPREEDGGRVGERRTRRHRRRAQLRLHDGLGDGQGYGRKAD